MGHGNAFPQFLHEAAEHRGATRPAASTGDGHGAPPVGPARRRSHHGQLEPWTIGGCGYPDLLATGELCEGDSIHDRQHPHDLFMELAVEYERPLDRAALAGIWRLAGEPALGPAAYPHRVSALPNPIAPIGHHWLDATHITFGVVDGRVFGTVPVEGGSVGVQRPRARRGAEGLDLAPSTRSPARFTWRPPFGVGVAGVGRTLNEAERRRACRQTT